MSKPSIKPFVELSNFQQWVIFFLNKNGRIGRKVESEITNFCDTTKDSIDMNNYEGDISKYQNELDYFHNAGLTKIASPDDYILKSKGQIYCYQNLEKPLGKLSTSQKMVQFKASELYRNNPRLCAAIISNFKNLRAISGIIIDNKKEAMENIKFFVQIIKLLFTL